MGQLVLFLVVALVLVGTVFGVVVLVTGTDRGLGAVEPDGRALPLPTDRPLVEGDLARARFDTALRGYRMAQVDQALRRAAYDIGYKDELISVLEAEIVALRAGRVEDAEVLRRARDAALVGTAIADRTAGAEFTAAADEATSVPEPDEPIAEADAPIAEPDAPIAEPDEPIAELAEPVAEAPPDQPDETDAALDETDEPAARLDQADTEPDTDADTDSDAEAAVSDAEAAVVNARSRRP